MVFLLAPLEKLGDRFQNDAVRAHYEILSKRRTSLFFKRVFDLIVSSLLICLLSPIMFIVFLLVKCTSKGPALFLQERVGRYGKVFRIMKFRTMVVNAEQLGAQVTSKEDKRVTKVGKVLRAFRLDEFPQIFHIFSGKMSFVGTRPEVPRYVAGYSDEMMATLLLPPGVTSMASIQFKDEAELLSDSDDPDATYLNEILPKKMELNLDYSGKVGVLYDCKTIFKTVWSVFF